VIGLLLQSRLLKSPTLFGLEIPFEVLANVTRNKRCLYCQVWQPIYSDRSTIKTLVLFHFLLFLPLPAAVAGLEPLTLGWRDQCYTIVLLAMVIVLFKG
jgi:hypothetical protein